MMIALYLCVVITPGMVIAQARPSESAR